MQDVSDKKSAATQAEGAFAAAYFARFGVSRQTIFELIDRYAALYRDMGAVKLPTAAGAVPAACSKGCWYCCHTIIVLTAPEAFYLADHIERTRDAEGLAALKEKVRAADTVTSGQPGDVRWGKGPPCPLLDTKEGACSVYEGRPLACRGAFSSSLPACEKAYAERATNPRSLGAEPFIFQNSDVVIRALALGLKSTGRSLYRLELNAALVSIWSTPNAFEAWLAGADVFQNARAKGFDGPLV